MSKKIKPADNSSNQQNENKGSGHTQNVRRLRVQHREYVYDGICQIGIDSLCAGLPIGLVGNEYVAHQLFVPYRIGLAGFFGGIVRYSNNRDGHGSPSFHKISIGQPSGFFEGGVSLYFFWIMCT